MALKLKIKAALITCGRCGKPRGLSHVCVIRADRPARKGRTKLAPKVSASVKCGSCGKPYANPLTHVCKPKSTARQQQRAAPRARKLAAGRPPRVKVVRPAKPKRPEHNYRTCRGDDCSRITCEAFREGREIGFEDGYAAAQGDAQ